MKQKCSRCELIPDKICGPGTMRLLVPLPHTLAKLRDRLQNAGIVYAQEEELLNLTIPDSDLNKYINVLLDVLSVTEIQDTKVIFQPAGKQLEVADYFKAQSLKTFIAKAEASWLSMLLEKQAFSCHFQPIIDLANHKIHAYECLLRAELDGKTIYPDVLFSAAQKSDLLFQLDLTARAVAVKAASDYGIKQKIFINFHPNAIYDPVFCLQKTLKLVDDLQITRDQIVFEVIENESITDRKHLLRILEFYKKTGFKIAIDDLGSGFSSLNLLSDLRPDYMKLDIGMIKAIDKEAYKEVITKKIIEAGQALGVIVLAEGIETEEEYGWCRAAGVHLGQGFFFGKASLVPVQEQEINLT